MRNVSDKFAGKLKIHIICSINFFYENGAVYEIIWKKYGESDKSLGRHNGVHAQCMMYN